MALYTESKTRMFSNKTQKWVEILMIVVFKRKGRHCTQFFSSNVMLNSLCVPKEQDYFCTESGRLRSIQLTKLWKKKIKELFPFILKFLVLSVNYYKTTLISQRTLMWISKLVENKNKNVPPNAWVFYWHPLEVTFS